MAGVSGAGCLIWGVVGRLVASGGVSCGVSCGGLFVVVSSGVSWGRLGFRRVVVRVVVRCVGFSCRCAGRGAARVSPCVSCCCAGREAACLFHVEDRRGGACFLCFCVLSPPPLGGGAGSFLQVVCVFSFKMGGIFSRFSLIFDVVFDIKKPPGDVFFLGGVLYMGEMVVIG